MSLRLQQKGELSSSHDQFAWTGFDGNAAGSEYSTRVGLVSPRWVNLDSVAQISQVWQREQAVQHQSASSDMPTSKE